MANTNSKKYYDILNSINSGFETNIDTIKSKTDLAIALKESLNNPEIMLSILRNRALRHNNYKWYGKAIYINNTLNSRKLWIRHRNVNFSFYHKIRNKF